MDKKMLTTKELAEAGVTRIVMTAQPNHASAEEKLNERIAVIERVLARDLVVKMPMGERPKYERELSDKLQIKALREALKKCDHGSENMMQEHIKKPESNIPSNQLFRVEMIRQHAYEGISASDKLLTEGLS